MREAQYIANMLECNDEQGCRCVGPLWDCLASIPWDRWFEILSLALGGLALVGMFTIIPILLWKALHERPHPR